MTLRPDDAMVMITYWLFFYVFSSAVFGLVTVNDWLANYCNAGRDAWIYQLSSPP